MDRLFEIVAEILSASPVLYILGGAVGIWVFLSIIALLDFGLVRWSAAAGLHHKKAQAAMTEGSQVADRRD